MKKIKYLLFVLLVGLFVTGCGSNEKTMKCTTSINNNSLDYSATYEISYTEDEIVKSVKTTEVLKSDDSDYLNQAKESAEDLYKNANSEYGGYSYNVKVSGNTLTSKCTVDYTKMNVKKYVEDNPSLTNFSDKDNNVKLDGVIQIYEALGAKCEK